jgi:lysophospholipase L1-like esterase
MRKGPAGRRNRWRKIVLALVVFAVTDVVLAQFAKRLLPGFDVYSEYLLRIPSHVYHHDLARNVDAPASWGPLHYRLTTNSLGFRDAENREVALRTAAPRLLMIGDSFTEGLGLDYANTYAGLITEKLAAEGIEALNAGVLSYSPTIYYRKVRYLIEDVGLAFDRLVVFLDISDIEDEATMYGMDESGRVTMQDPGAWIDTARILTPTDHVKRFLKSNSLVFRLASIARAALRGGDDDGPAFVPPEVTKNPRALWTVDERLYEQYGRRGLEAASQRMEQLAAFLRPRGIDLTVVVYPWPEQVFHGDRESRQVTHWREWTQRHGATFVNLFPPFFGEDKSVVLAKYFIPDDMHFNEAGNRLIAQEFLAAWPRR